jgi:hypothetical protein
MRQFTGGPWRRPEIACKSKDRQAGNLHFASPLIGWMVSPAWSFKGA